MLFTCKWLAK